MISKFVRERRCYTRDELLEIFGGDKEKATDIIKKLILRGILKREKNKKDTSENEDEDIELDENINGKAYVFKFVGIIDINGIILKCYPKYLLSYEKSDEESNKESNKELLKQFKIALKAIEKYGKKLKEKNIKSFYDSGDIESIDRFSLLIFLINDYYENNIYNNWETISESNGSGEIIWDRTIDRNEMILSDDAPYYINLQTRKNVINYNDYFTRLHKCILIEATKELRDAGLTELFDITEPDLFSDEELDDFGDSEYIFSRIEKELNVQFNTRKRLVLKAIYAYVSTKEILSDEDCFMLYGTNSFHVVWEKACAEIFDNQLNKKLSELKLPKPICGNEDKAKKLIELIEKPTWTYTGKTSQKTLIPDVISISGKSFIILDAKYYIPHLEKGKTPYDQPGIESVTKQYLYQLAYKEFIENQGFEDIRNYFLFPIEKTKDNKIISKGEVKMEMLSSLELKNIQVRFLPADRILNMYLSGETMDIKELDYEQNCP